MTMGRRRGVGCPGRVQVEDDASRLIWGCADSDIDVWPLHNYSLAGIQHRRLRLLCLFFLILRRGGANVDMIRRKGPPDMTPDFTEATTLMSPYRTASG